MTIVIQKEVYKQDFLQHINSVDPAIQFTVETNKEDGAIPFLDIIVTPEAGGKSVHHCVQETHAHSLVPTVGQLPPPVSKI